MRQEAGLSGGLSRGKHHARCTRLRSRFSKSFRGWASAGPACCTYQPAIWGPGALALWRRLFIRGKAITGCWPGAGAGLLVRVGCMSHFACGSCTAACTTAWGCMPAGSWPRACECPRPCRRRLENARRIERARWQPNPRACVTKARAPVRPRHWLARSFRVVGPLAISSPSSSAPRHDPRGRLPVARPISRPRNRPPLRRGLQGSAGRPRPPGGKLEVGPVGVAIGQRCPAAAHWLD